MAVNDKRIKVTDKRMFTAEGELREEYRDLEGGNEVPAGSGEEPAPSSSETVDAPESRAPEGVAAEPPPPTKGRPTEATQKPAAPARAATFLDLVGTLAEPIALYLGDVPLPDGGSAENLDAARVHIDLLEVLQKKTKGNLDSQESALLDDLLYRLRLRYVQKRG